MIPFFFAWAIGESFIVYRWVRAGAPPTPGALAAPAALFVGLAVIAQEPRARAAATAFAFALDLAIALQVVGKVPDQVTGWPPAMINDPGVIMPGGASAAPSTSAATTGGTGTETV